MSNTERIALIKQRLQILNPQQLVVTDESESHHGHAGAQSGGGHFSVEIVADIFNQKSLPERHRLIYQALGELMQSEIHALRIRAKAPNE
jgi:stress-induced morphogen